MPSGAEITQWAGLIVAAMIGIAFGIQRVLKNWKETGASSNVVSLLHAEVTRMGQHNETLLTKLTQLQTEILALQLQVGRLTVENNNLRSQVETLTAELDRVFHRDINHSRTPNQ